MSQSEEEVQFFELYDVMMTLELAVKFAERNPNTAIRNAWSVIEKRVKHPQNISNFRGLCKNPFPAGALAMMRRKFDEVMSENKTVS